MFRIRTSASELAGAIAGAGAIGLAYAAGRRYGLTTSNVAETLAPDSPYAGRVGQIGLGTLAALPGTRVATPLRALAVGAALGGLAAREGRAFSAGAHALAAVVAQQVTARL